MTTRTDKLMEIKNLIKLLLNKVELFENLQEYDENNSENYIAKVNENKTEIVALYLSEEVAKKHNELHMLEYTLKTPFQVLCRDFYYVYYKDCDEILKKNLWMKDVDEKMWMK